MVFLADVEQKLFVFN